MFYENVRDLCAMHRTNITQLAKDLGISTSMPTKWKHGSIPKADTLQKIAEHFGVTTDALLQSTPPASFGDVSGSAVLLGNRGRDINVHNGAASLSSEETELLRIYRALDVRARLDLIRFAFDMEDKKKGE